MQHSSPYSAPFSGKQKKGVYAISTGPFMYNARVVTIIPADSYASPDLNKEYDSHDSSTTSCANAEPDFSSTSIVAVADANPSAILTDVIQPAADKTYTLFGSLCSRSWQPRRFCTMCRRRPWPQRALTRWRPRRLCTRCRRRSWPPRALTRWRPRRSCTRCTRRLRPPRAMTRWRPRRLCTQGADGVSGLGAL